MTQVDILEAEIKAFTAMLPELRRTYGSIWAVLVGPDFKAGFPEFSEAAQYAMEHFSDRQFLIRHTQQHTAHIPFVAIEA